MPTDDSLLGSQLVWEIRYARWESRIERALLSALEEAEHSTIDAMRGLVASSHGGTFDLGRWRRILDMRVRPVVEGVMAEVSARLLDYMVEAIGRTWNVAVDLSSQVQRLIDKAYGIGPVIAERVGHELAAGIGKGESIPELTARVRDSFATNEYRARTIARTETISTVNEGQYETARTITRTTGATSTKRWIAARDHRTRPSHRTAHGQVQPLDQQFQLGDARLAFPGDPTGPAEEVINCVTGDTLVAAEAVDVGFRRWYSGPLVTIEGAHGHRLTVTPNHPILTGSGWQPAGHLRPGDHLVCGCRYQEVAAGHPHIEQPPARIDQVVDAGTPGSPRRRVRGTDVQFHGDGQPGQIEVVGTRRHLRVERQSSVTTPPGEHPLNRGGLALSLLSPSRVGRTLISPRHLSAPGLVRCGSQARSPRSVGAAHPQSHGISSAPGLNPRLQQPTSEPPPVSPDLVSERLFRLTGEVSLDQVRHISIASWSGHVFNLSTRHNYYAASGYIVHNCRCAVAFTTVFP